MIHDEQDRVVEKKGDSGAALERTVVKLVGRRRASTSDWEDVRQLLRTAAALRPSPELVPCGVYRFSTFDEADDWMRETMARTLARRRSRTSSGSAAR